MTSGMSGACPVCRWPSESQAACAECGLRSDADSASLSVAQRRRDEQAARLAAAGDADALDVLLRLSRGVPPGALPGAHRRTTNRLDENLVRDVAARYQLSALVDDLVRGTGGELALLRVRPAGLACDLITADRMGVPCRRRPQSRWPWRTLAARLPVDGSRRRFHLAGGIGTEGAIDPYAVVNALITGLPELDLPPDVTLVLIEPDDKWRLPWRLAAAAREHYRPGLVLPGRMLQQSADPTHAPGGGDDPHEAFELIRRGAPLRYGYAAVIADPNSGGAARLRAVPLFPGGATATQVAYTPRTVRLRLRAADAADDLVLPIVALSGRRVADWSLVGMWSATLTDITREDIEACVTLDGPGRITLGGTVRFAPDQRRWPDLRQTVERPPSRSPATPVDVACIVEICDGVRARERLRTLHELLTLLSSGPDGMQVALLGYRQHNDARPAVRYEDFRPAAAAAVALGRWQPEPNMDDHAAAMEDAVVDLGQLRWRPQARRVVVSLGSRPPYVHRHGMARSRPCRRRIDWEAALKALHSDERYRLVALWEPPGWWDTLSAGDPLALRTQEAWGRLGTDGFFIAGRTTVADVARAAGLEQSTSRTAPFAVAADPAQPHS